MQNHARSRRAGLLTTLLIAASVIPGILTAPLGASPLNYVSHEVDGAFVGAVEVSVADMDGDGDLDVAGAAFDGSEVCWWEFDGVTGFTKHSVATGAGFPRSVRVVDEEGNPLDMDGDGDVDLLAACWTATAVKWWENDGTGLSFTEHVIDNTHTGAHTAVARDIDGDGDLDVACTGRRLSWYENDGAGGYTVHTLFYSTAVGQNLCAVDNDDDGDIDFLEARSGSFGPRWYENDGSQNFTIHDVDTSFTNSHTFLPGDLDGDGDRDYIGASLGIDEFAWWENRGMGGLVRHTVLLRDQAISISSADLDNDGDRDLVGAAAGEDGVFWWENDGAQNFTTHLVTEDVNDPYHVLPVDLDQDGQTDFIVSCRIGNSVVWWRNDTNLSVSLTCIPSSGTLPFNTSMTVTLDNPYEEYSRRLAARIDVSAAGGFSISNWRSGHTTIQPGEHSATAWNQTIPALGSLVGDTEFLLSVEDVTPPPFNAPPYPPSGNRGTDACTVTGLAP